MNRVICNKLIRDKIPEIIKSDKGVPKIRIMNDKEYEIELLKKIIEEAKEVYEAKENKKEISKEIGDVYEVIDSIIDFYGLDKKEIEEIKKRRLKERGGFKEKLFLKHIDR